MEAISHDWLVSSGASNGGAVPVCLDRRTYLHAVHSRGVRFEVEAGTAWLTQDGMLADVVLGPGQSWRAPNDERVVVSGLPWCRLTVRAEQAADSTSARSRRRRLFARWLERFRPRRTVIVGV
ncbi:MAG TPA: DUF2917 domain-containing protein [Burkholderiaceae bacterium]|nr:DUF2917 domain-containing protein [Burkholderiaceae bacterium]